MTTKKKVVPMYAHKVLKDWFTKKHGGKKMFSKNRKRWFVLDDHSITYFEKSAEEKAKGNIFLEQIKQVKTNGRELLLFTPFRTFSLTADTMDQTIEWADAIETRLKDSETLKKVIKKAEKLIKKSSDVEKHSKELVEYINTLKDDNKKLKSENDTLKKELKKLKKKKKK